MMKSFSVSLLTVSFYFVKKNLFAKILTLGRNVAEAADRVPIVVEEMMKSFVRRDTVVLDEVSKTIVTIG